MTDLKKPQNLLDGSIFKEDKEAIQVANTKPLSSQLFDGFSKHDDKYVYICFYRNEVEDVRVFNARFKSNNRIGIEIPAAFNHVYTRYLGIWKNHFKSVLDDDVNKKYPKMKRLTLTFELDIDRKDIYESMKFHYFIRPFFKDIPHCADILKSDPDNSFSFTKTEDETIAIFEYINCLDFSFNKGDQSVRIRAEKAAVKVGGASPQNREG